MGSSSLFWPEPPVLEVTFATTGPFIAHAWSQFCDDSSPEPPPPKKSQLFQRFVCLSLTQFIKTCIFTITSGGSIVWQPARATRELHNYWRDVKCIYLRHISSCRILKVQWLQTSTGHSLCGMQLQMHLLCTWNYDRSIQGAGWRIS